MKNFIIACSMLLLTACGANVHKSSGVENQQFILLVNESLVGKTISVGEIKDYLIAKKDLLPYATGVLGVTDSELENSDVLKIKVNQGTTKLEIKDHGKVIFLKDIYLTSGQTRTISF